MTRRHWLLLTATGFAVAVLGLTAAGSTSAAWTSAAWTGTVAASVAANSGLWAPAVVVIQPTDGNTEVQGVQWTMHSDNGSSFCTDAVVTGANETPTAWSLTADLTKPPFNGIDLANGGNIYYQGNQVALTPQPADHPTSLLITGVSNGTGWNASYNNALLTSSQSLTITLCATGAPVPPAPAEGQTPTYTVAVSEPEVTWPQANEIQVCRTLTVTGTVTDLVSNPFYFGWTAGLDMTGAAAIIEATPRPESQGGGAYRVNDIAWDPWPSEGYQFTTSPAPSSNSETPTNHVGVAYTITSGRQTAIRGTGVTHVTSCLHGY